MRVGARRRRQRTARVPRADRRRRIVEAAARVFLRRGYASARVRDLAREAGVARGTFYAHFDSKRHVLDLLARGWLDALLPPDPKDPIPDRAALERALHEAHGRVLAAFVSHHAAARLLYGEDGARGPGLARALLAHEREWARRLSAPLVLAKAAGWLRDDVDVARVSECALGMAVHVARGLAAGADPREVEAWTDALTRIHLAAVS